jgi:hypothetical protein
MMSSEKRMRLRGDSAAVGSRMKWGALLRTIVMPNLATTVSAASMADVNALTASSTVVFNAAIEASASVAVVVGVDIWWFDGFDDFRFPFMEND